MQTVSRCSPELPPRLFAAGDDSASMSGVFSAGHTWLRVFLLQKFCPKGLRRNAICPAYGLAEHTLIVTARKTWQTLPRILIVDAYQLQHEKKVVPLAPESIVTMDQEDYQVLVGCGVPLEGVEGRWTTAYDPLVLRASPGIVVVSACLGAGFFFYTHLQIAWTFLPLRILPSLNIGTVPGYTRARARLLLLTLAQLESVQCLSA